MIPILTVLALLAQGDMAVPEAAALARTECVGQASGLETPDSATGGRAVIYVEEDLITHSRDSLVEMRSRYRDEAGATLAERTLDFSKSRTRPGYDLKDFRSGLEEGASVDGGGVRVYSRSTLGGVRKERVLAVPEPFVIDGGFHLFIQDHWEALVIGKRITFYFVVPSRLDYFRFVLFEDHEDQERTAHGPGEKVFVAVPQSRILRMLIEPIVTRYDGTTRRMKEYRGLSNLQGPDGKSRKIRLVYREPGL